MACYLVVMFIQIVSRQPRATGSAKYYNIYRFEPATWNCALAPLGSAHWKPSPSSADTGLVRRRTVGRTAPSQIQRFVAVHPAAYVTHTRGAASSLDHHQVYHVKS